jgi:hypothetical protein
MLHRSGVREGQVGSQDFHLYQVVMSHPASPVSPFSVSRKFFSPTPVSEEVILSPVWGVVITAQ